MKFFMTLTFALLFSTSSWAQEIRPLRGYGTPTMGQNTEGRFLSQTPHGQTDAQNCCHVNTAYSGELNTTGSASFSPTEDGSRMGTGE